jgi:hypothetical protein
VDAQGGWGVGESDLVTLEGGVAHLLWVRGEGTREMLLSERILCGRKFSVPFHFLGTFSLFWYKIFFWYISSLLNCDREQIFWGPVPNLLIRF